MRLFLALLLLLPLRLVESEELPRRRPILLSWSDAPLDDWGGAPVGGPFVWHVFMSTNYSGADTTLIISTTNCIAVPSGLPACFFSVLRYGEYGPAYWCTNLVLK